GDLSSWLIVNCHPIKQFIRENCCFLHTSQHSGENISSRVAILSEGQSQTGYKRLFYIQHARKRSNFTWNSVVSRSLIPAVLAIRASCEDNFIGICKRNGFAFCWWEVVTTIAVEGVGSTLRNLVRIKFQ